MKLSWKAGIPAEAAQVSRPRRGRGLPDVRHNRAALILAAALCFAPTPLGAEEQVPARYETVRIAVDPTRPPYQFWSGGRLAGFNIDLINRIGVHHGVRVILLPMDRETGRAALAAGRVDAILGYPLSPEVSDTVDFSEPLAASSIGVLVSRDGDLFRQGLSNLTDGVLSLTRYSPAYEFLKSIRAIRFNETSTAAEALDLLALGRSDALLEDRMTVLYLLRERDQEDRFRFAASYWLPVEYTVAVGKNDSYLLYLIDSGLREMKNSGVYSALFERWFREEEYETRAKLRRLFGWFTGLVLVSLLLGALSVWWTRQLSFRVRERTADLNRSNEELVRQMEETEDEKEFVHQILESSPRGLVTCDRDGVISVCNSRAREIGKMEGDPVGTRYDRYPLLERFLGGKVEPILSEGRQYLFETERWAQPDGAALLVRYSLYPLRGHDQAIKGVIFSFEDYTGQKALQDRIFEREKNQALSRLVAGVAHEIRNPLTSIKAFVELLPKKAGNPQFLREMANYVPREVERVDDLIRNLIDFARPRKGSGCRENLAELAGSCAVLLSPMAAKRGFRLVTEIGDPLFAFVDRDQVKQCVLNFVLNAVDALEELDSDDADRLEIILAVRAEGPNVRVEVRDRGAGMTEEEVSRALEPFYTTKAKGVGLGLPLARQYVEENRGVLRIASVKGEGTVMIMEFPGEGA